MDFIIVNIIGWLKQVRSLLFSIVGILPVIILFFTATQFICFIGLEYLHFPEWTYRYVEITRQVVDMSLFGLILLFILSKHYRFISRVSLACLCLLWLLNTIYILFNLQADTYFYCFSSIIYITFVVLTVWKLKNR